MQRQSPLVTFRQNLGHLQAKQALSPAPRFEAFVTALAGDRVSFLETERGRQLSAMMDAQRQRREAKWRVEARVQKLWWPMKSIAWWFKDRQLCDALAAAKERGEW